MTDRYPLQVIRQSGRAASRSGGKDYHLVKITSVRGDGAMIIHRWGRKDTWDGGWNVERHDNCAEATRAYERKWKEKLGKQYSDHFLDTTTLCANAEQLRKALGANFFKLGTDHLLWLDPDIDTSGARATLESESLDDETYAPPARRLVDESEAPKESTAAKALDPNWGLF